MARAHDVIDEMNSVGITGLLGSAEASGEKARLQSEVAGVLKGYYLSALESSHSLNEYAFTLSVLSADAQTAALSEFNQGAGS